MNISNLPVRPVLYHLGVCAAGASVGFSVFNKLLSVIDYNIIKIFGDYKHPEKTLDGKVIISMSRRSEDGCPRTRPNRYYYVLNTCLAPLAAVISFKVTKILLNHLPGGWSHSFNLALLIGSVAMPIFLSLFNMVVYHDTRHQNYIYVPDSKLSKYGIGKEKLSPMESQHRVYCNHGFDCEWEPGVTTGF